MKTLFALFFSAATLVGFSQRAQQDLTPQDPKAQAILDALSNKAKSFSTFQADFEYTLKSDEVNETQRGSVMMKGQQKYKVKVAGQEVMSDGKTVWTYIPDAGELQISDLPAESDDEGNMMNPANAFHLYQKGFKYKYEGPATVDGVAVEVVKLFPINPEKKKFHTVIMNVNTQKNELVSVIVKTKDGSTYTYKLKNFKANIPLADSEFTFDESKAEDVIDLRD